MIRHVRTSVGLQRTMLLIGIVLTVVFLVTAAFAPLLAPYGYAQLSSGDVSFGSQQPPSAEHWLGTTVGGYDVLSRTIWGARPAFLVIVVAVALSIFAGVIVGLVSGYFGGWIDRVLVVIADALFAFPSLLLAIVVAIVISGGQSSMWGGVMAAAISLSVVMIPQYFRVVRCRGGPRQGRGVRRVRARDRLGSRADHGPPRAAQLDPHPAVDPHAQLLRGRPHAGRARLPSGSASSRRRPATGATTCPGRCRT